MLERVEMDTFAFWNVDWWVETGVYISSEIYTPGVETEALHRGAEFVKAVKLS